MKRAVAQAAFLTLALGCAGKAPHAVVAEAPVAAPIAPAPAEKSARDCPMPAERLPGGSLEPSVAPWAEGIRLAPCPGDVLPGERKLCAPDGRLAVWDYEPRRSHRIFDEQGRETDEWWDAAGARAHNAFRFQGGCLLRASDDSGDGIADTYCRSPEGCRAPSCMECGPYRRPLESQPCAAPCPAGIDRCGCDAKGRLVEEIADARHSRVATRYDEAGRIAERDTLFAGALLSREVTRYGEGGREVEATGFRDGQPISESKTRYDAQDRIVERSSRQEGSGEAVTSTQWKDGGFVTTTTVGGVFQERWVRDQSVPGERRDVWTDAQGSSRTTLIRERDGQSVSTAFETPMQEPWFACTRDADCVQYVDPCNCDRHFFVNARSLAKLKSACKPRCAHPPPCPAVVWPAVPPGARCVLGLCAARER